MAPSQLSSTFSTEALQSLGVELASFCATIAIALLIKMFFFKSDSSDSPKLRAYSSHATGHQISTKTPPLPVKEVASPCAEQLGGRRAPPKIALHGPALTLNTIMERASNKNSTEALALYAGLRSNGQHLRIKEFLQTSSRHSALDFYSALVQSAVRASKPQLVGELLEDMAAAEIERTLSFYESVMKVLAGKKHYQQALAVYDRLTLEGLMASPVTLSCLINFTVELGELDRAIGFFEQLSSISIPSIRAYMMALRVYSKRQDYTKSLEILRSMQARSVPIDSLILNSVLSTGVAAGKGEAAEALLHEMSKTNAEAVDVISYNTVLKGYAHSKIADKALRLLDRMLDRGVTANSITFNTVMDAAVRGSHVADAWNVLERMQTANLQPDKYTCTILMKALHEDSTPKQLSRVLEMLQAALPQCDSALRSSLFHGLFQVAARVNNTALLISAFEEMKKHHISPTTMDYQILIQTLAQQANTSHCSAIWRHALTSADVGPASRQQPSTSIVSAIFAAVMEELAKRESVEGMICAFESLHIVIAEGWPNKNDAEYPSSQKKSGNNASELMHQCRAALIQAASRRQHSVPAFRRLLELAPKHGLTLEAFSGS